MGVEVCGHIQDHCGGRPGLLVGGVKRGRVDQRLEGRTGLAGGQRHVDGSGVFVVSIIRAADHCQYFSGVGVQRDRGGVVDIVPGGVIALGSQPFQLVGDRVLGQVLPVQVQGGAHGPAAPGADFFVGENRVQPRSHHHHKMGRFHREGVRRKNQRLFGRKLVLL